MSSTPPAGLTPPLSNSRPTSPSGSDKPRAVSGSLKDRIAKFNNPSAAPLVPSHPFGSAGPAFSSSSSTVRGGLVGNRIPSVSSGNITVPVPGQQRKVSEQKGLIGNRIPSVSGSNKMPSIATGSLARSASPSGSVNSSTASGRAGTSASPSTSRSSSPPTSPGTSLPPSLLSSTLPGGNNYASSDAGGTGALTPSSTRAEAGENTSELSMPTTPVAGATIDLPPPEHDLVPGNLRLASQMQRQLSAGSGAPRSFAPSIGSSLASQYDPGSAEGEAEGKQMMHDVSEISTPTGTPTRRGLGDGSIAGSSVRGEGSVIGEGEVEGEGEEMDEVAKKLEALGVKEDMTPGPLSGTHATEDEDPNTADDLDALKAGELSRSPGPEPAVNAPEPNAVDNIAQAGFEQNVAEHVIPPSEQKQQGGEAGQRMEDVETADSVEEPKSRSEYFGGEGDGEDLDVRDASSSPSPDGSGGPNPTDAVHPEQRHDESHEHGSGASDMREQVGAPAENEDHPKMTKGSTQWFENEAKSEQEKQDDANKVDPVVEATEEASGEGRTTEEVERDIGKALMAADEGEEADVPGGDPKVAQVNQGAETEDQALETKTDAPKLGKEEELVKEEVRDEPALTLGSAPGGKKPMQVEIEPAPVAQPAPASDKPDVDVPSAPVDLDSTPSLEPTFPEPPHTDPDALDPNPAPTDPADSAPLDDTLVKSFPDVPDEDKPRVQVHVSSSPHATPTKPARSGSIGQDDNESSTPVATLPGQSKSLGNQQIGGSPKELGVEDSHATPKQEVMAAGRRLSARLSPRSPLLGDEDPGDFQPGESGWAVVTKGRDT